MLTQTIRFEVLNEQTRGLDSCLKARAASYSVVHAPLKQQYRNMALTRVHIVFRRINSAQDFVKWFLKLCVAWNMYRDIVRT